ncbi:cytochrome c [Vreelandella aquamarina]|uniref:Cytochrome c n=1 Tax=Vreelandella aquamarina TaxID=77097 RepID=A0A6F8XAN1_9GAMM|nr:MULTISPECIES: c-type cytochrome [Halomonas]MCD1652971.1 cytochrome c4 [Halomonas axialensis]MCD2089342.1 cytochrome c4 [Halomonas meridiana]PHR02272.1 MAG: cytochrome c4 [Halomonas sp.]BCB70735.1 cytochrome c [Halomonas meridiana]
MKTVHGGRLSLLLGACIIASTSVAQEGDAERGEAASATCVACHQANGGGMNISGGESWPRLAGLNSNYIAKQLHDFKAGDRQNATMVTFANMLDDQQIADVAAYYSQLPATPGQGGDNADEALLARGEQLAERGDWNAYIVSCKSCHGPGGQGVGETFPGIAGQHAGYISAQLNAWKSDTRSNDPQNLMGAIAKRMSEEDIQAVSAWYATQPAAEGEAAQ